MPERAASIRSFSLRDWFAVLHRLWLNIDRRNLGLIAAGVGFYTLLGLFPALAAAIAVWGIVADPAVLEAQLETIAPIVPDQAFTLLDRQVRALIAANNSTLGWTFALSLVGALWSARAGMTALIRGLNAVYGQTAKGSFLLRLSRALLLTTTLIGMSLVALTTVLVLPTILAFLPLGVMAHWVASLLHWAAALGVMLFGLGLVYRYGPDRRPLRARWVSSGAVVALLLWGSGSLLLTLYFRNFSNFNEVYGSIGAVAVLLVWFYLSAFSVLIGAQLNAEIEAQRLGIGDAPEDTPAA